MNAFRSWFLLRAPLLWTGCVAALACSSTDSSTPAREPSRFEDVVSWVRELRLEENPEVLNVAPAVTLDPRRGFLVADFRETQLRRYSREGALLWHAGSKGGGPGEFSTTSQVVRLRSGEILAADFDHRLTIFDTTASSVVRTIETGLRRIEDLAVVDDSLILISGLPGGNPAGPRLHLWNLRSDTIVRSFFAPFEGLRNKVAATVADWTRASLRGDTLAVVFSLSDTVYYYTLAGEQLGATPLPSRAFRRVGPDVPSGLGNPEKRAEWLASFDLVSDVHWLSDGRLLVLYQSLEPGPAFQPGGSLDRAYHLLKMTRTGDLVFEFRDVPRLLAVDPETDSLYFVTPGAEAPNRWSVARMLH